MNSIIDLGLASALDHARYTLRLSTGKQLVLFRLPKIPSPKSEPEQTVWDGWQYFCMEAECPHAGGPMDQSEVTLDVEDSSYTASCPWHSYDFDLDTGKSSYGIKACTFPIEVVDGRLLLKLEQDTGLVVSLSQMAPVSEEIMLKASRGPLHRSANGMTNSAAPPHEQSSLSEWCTYILNTSDPERKIELTTELFKLFVSRETSPEPMHLGTGTYPPPIEPPRSNQNQVQPWATPTLGRGGSLKSRITILHSLGNIEQWAIDLAIDICVRFAHFEAQGTSEPLPRTFYHDWLKVANDEAKHFSLLRARLEEMGSYFGALPVHHGLWESAKMTSHDLRARISIIALVHEARGLDVNPMTIEKFRKAGDPESVRVLSIIHNDEITHVTTGHRWLSWICDQEGTDPVKVFRQNVQTYFKGAVKGPFNAEARDQAGMSKDYYEDLSGRPWKANVIAGG